MYELRSNERDICIHWGGGHSVATLQASSPPSQTLHLIWATNRKNKQCQEISPKLKDFFHKLKDLPIPFVDDAQKSVKKACNWSWPCERMSNYVVRTPERRQKGGANLELDYRYSVKRTQQNSIRYALFCDTIGNNSRI